MIFCEILSLYNQKIFKSNRDIYYLCESIYWTSWSYSVFSINIPWVAWMSGWPSGLRRQTQGPYVFVVGVLVHECGRGFESHFWQNSILLSLRKNNYVWYWFSVKVCLFNQKILKSTPDIYYLCESIYWTSWSYSVFFISIRWPVDVSIAGRSKAEDTSPVFSCGRCSLWKYLLKSWSFSVFFLNIRWLVDVRMAERSKAPNSRPVCICDGCSGPRMWAWVRISILTM